MLALWREISFLGIFLFLKKDFLNWAFLLRNWKILSVRIVVLQIHFVSGPAWIQNDFFGIRIRIFINVFTSGSVYDKQHRFFTYAQRKLYEIVISTNKIFGQVTTEKDANRKIFNNIFSHIIRINRHYSERHYKEKENNFLRDIEMKLK